MSTETDEQKNPKYYKIVKGYPVFFFHDEKIIEEIFEYTPHDGDIIVSAYPKAGINWICFTVLQILTNAKHFQNFNDLFYKMAPFIQMSGVSGIEELTSPRVFKYSFPYDLMKRNPNSKMIYIYRKPEDVFISFYHYIKNITGSLDFDTFLEDFLTGNVPYGNYFKHISSFLEHKDDKNILLISYENLSDNRKEEILRVAKFLGDTYYNNLIENESIMEKIIEHTSFEYMKKNFVLTYPETPERIHDMFKNSNDIPTKYIDFFRKGKIGDGHSVLNENQLQRIRQTAEKMIKDSKLLIEWFGK